MKKVIIGVSIVLVCVISFLYYVVVGTCGNVAAIKTKAPAEMEQRGWEIMRYEGFMYGSFDKHGGYAWYHVKDLNVKDTYYRVKVSMWGGELQYYYGAPEKIQRVNISHDTTDVGALLQAL